MGKSTSSCFKLITCGGGGDAVENHASQFQDSTDKRGWSFRKKSSTHRVLSNTATPSSTANKESSQSSNFNFQPLPEPNLVNKISTPNQKPQVSETNVIDDAESNKVDVKNPPESSAATAQRELLQVESIVKLQGAVRGYLVRKNSVGTLHCVQAVTKDVDEKTKDCTSDIDSKPTVGDSVLLTEDEGKGITYEDTNFKFQASRPTLSIVKDDLERAPAEEAVAYDDAKVASAETESFQNEKSVSEASAPPELNVNYLDQKPEIPGDKQKRSIKGFVSDQLDAEGKKPINGSSKASNPVFFAAQSKFEELSSMSNLGRTSSLPYQDAASEFESQGDTSFVVTDTVHRSKELTSENPGPHLSRVSGSECGTELSITSTLDSPGVSEVGAMENERGAKDLVEGTGNLENTIKHDNEGNVPCTLPASDLATSVSNQSEIVDDISVNMVPSVAAVDSGKPTIETETNASDFQKEQAEAVLHDLKSSPDASPRSHVTVPESQGTPSSQVSVKPKTGKTKSRSSNKRSSLSMGNNSPANANHDSGSRGSGEQLPKDQRNDGKRRNSFGSVKPDHIDQEPKDNTSSNNSLPRFMQATQSARAKLNANNSPRSSPDVHEGDVQVIKRHSLPGSTGRQVSPRIQRSMSQAQQSTKANSEQSPQERKWLR
ncbi:protein IQ-DOMAIN 32-like [Lotus japonicus]|uniref:protein IQ-DOMAIN 32-like n=1 Tax=Lotus japonicus TaxID=34305 RepID=UPI00258EEE96|nr:protein IQ-DOMAIN 32-like [Lotus japonicus]